MVSKQIPHFHEVCPHIHDREFRAAEHVSVVHSGGECLSASILFIYERRMSHLFVLSRERVRRGALGIVVSV